MGWEDAGGQVQCSQQIWPCAVLYYSPSFNCCEPWFLHLQNASQGCTTTLILFVSGWGHSHTPGQEPVLSGILGQLLCQGAAECCSKPLGSAGSSQGLQAGMIDAGGTKCRCLCAVGPEAVCSCIYFPRNECVSTLLQEL